MSYIIECHIKAITNEMQPASTMIIPIMLHTSFIVSRMLLLPSVIHPPSDRYFITESPDLYIQKSIIDKNRLNLHICYRQIV